MSYLRWIIFLMPLALFLACKTERDTTSTKAPQTEVAETEPRPEANSAKAGASEVEKKFEAAQLYLKLGELTKARQLFVELNSDTLTDGDKSLLDALEAQLVAEEHRIASQLAAERDGEAKSQMVSKVARLMARAEDAVLKLGHTAGNTRQEVDNILSTEQKLSLNRTYQSQEESLYKKYVTQLTPMVKDMTPEQAANYLADLGQKFMQEISR